MEKEKAEKARLLLKQIEEMKDIKSAIKNESDHWWTFKSPNTSRENGGDGLYFPSTFRKFFADAVIDTMTELEKQLEEL